MYNLPLSVDKVHHTTGGQPDRSGATMRVASDPPELTGIDEDVV